MRRVAAVLIGLTAVAGCGGPGSSVVRATGPEYEVATAALGGLGTVLVDGQGYTLYLYVPDDHSSRSTCTGICIANWPPLLLPSGVALPLAGRGVHASLLGTTTRSDGGTQVTYDGWPLYLWANDTGPGQHSGQGLYNSGGLWFVVSPDGEPIRSSP